ncbi:MAG: ABC transporter ATP-binding protein/permease [Clostridia bacterium]|nr:ABC transporter ATP-binding protein/permease [Clostridia bacterium]
MLELKNITKNYYVGDTVVEALKGVSLSFRKSEFVSILGPSGCGKTTLLNIIGGLDRYTAGDIIIDGISTKLYLDKDWDAYRNHSIGFVFQSYNLIPHQTVLANVELALTLSGVAPTERRERAIKALEKVGLADQIKKLPAQLSGGQMQRVAIARAIVNDPEIILADEPTGALDTETSVQIMNILKELATERLVIMVTHNPELAKEYSTRIINLKDGLVKDDSNVFAYTSEERDKEQEKSLEEAKKTRANRSMSFKTALQLSLKNLGTKKARTLLTSFAGSIGIIGIALILSLSAGFSTYINNVQRDTLSNYPVTISNASMDMTSFVTAFMGEAENVNDLEKYPETESLSPNPMLETLMSGYSQSLGSNDLSSFKKYLDEKKELLDSNRISTIQYGYSFNLNLFQKEGTSYKQVNEIGPMEYYMPENIGSTLMNLFQPYYTSFKAMMSTNNSWAEMLGSDKLLKAQYDLLAGDWPTMEKPKNGANWPLLVVVDEYNRIPDYALYMMGLLSDDDVRYIFTRMAYNMQYANNKELVDAKLKETFPNYQLTTSLSFNDIIGKKYNVILNGELYEEDESKRQTIEGVNLTAYKLISTDDLKTLLDKQEVTLEIVGVVRLKEGTAGGSLSKNMYYTPALTEYLLDKTQTLDSVKAQLSLIDISISNIKGSWDILQNTFTIDNNAELSNTLYRLGIADKSTPSSISIYPATFEDKDYVIQIINDYNKGKDESEQIKYTDYLGMMMDSITVIINAITYVLIAFVSISLIVSSIMIGVITYISVLERTKEIGVLRAMGASKRDVARVFNAETAIIGFASGMLGITITVLLNIPISLIIKSLTAIANVASLPLAGGIALVLISVTLTIVAGIIPSNMASKKDPVIALRSE